jgi:hypothetical protein
MLPSVQTVARPRHKRSLPIAERGSVAVVGRWRSEAVASKLLTFTIGEARPLSPSSGTGGRSERSRLAKGNYRLAYDEPFNQRASWRFVRHSGHDQSGGTRWKCPFHEG